MKLYKGKSYSVAVYEDGKFLYKLKPYNRLTPAFCWGRGGLCAGELAYAILSDCCGRRTAEKYHVAFKWEVVVNLRKKGFVLNESTIKSWLEKQKRKQRTKTFGFLRDFAVSVLVLGMAFSIQSLMQQKDYIYSRNVFGAYDSIQGSIAIPTGAGYWGIGTPKKATGLTLLIKKQKKEKK